MHILDKKYRQQQNLRGLLLEMVIQLSKRGKEEG